MSKPIYSKQYRVMVKRPGGKRFVLGGYVPSPAIGRGRYSNSYYKDKGWEVRIDERTIVRENGPWKVVADEDA